MSNTFCKNCHRIPSQCCCTTLIKKETNDMNLRDEFASRVLAGMCAGDWKLDLTNGKTWDEMASKRAYEIADAMIKEREISNV